MVPLKPPLCEGKVRKTVGFLRGNRRILSCYYIMSKKTLRSRRRRRTHKLKNKKQHKSGGVKLSLNNRRNKDLKGLELFTDVNEENEEKKEKEKKSSLFLTLDSRYDRYLEPSPDDDLNKHTKERNRHVPGMKKVLPSRP